MPKKNDRDQKTKTREAMSQAKSVFDRILDCDPLPRAVRALVEGSKIRENLEEAMGDGRRKRTYVIEHGRRR